MSPPRFLPRRHFSASLQPYYVSAPDYRQDSAGIRALHMLCNALNESGAEAYVTTQVVHPQLRTPTLSKETMLRHYATGRQPIAVYPEVVTDNPLQTAVVARWLLNNIGHLAKPIELGESDLVFRYATSIEASIPTHGMITMPTFDPEIFNNEDNPHDQEREIFCYYAGKYLAFGGVVAPDIVQHGVSLCRDIPRSHAEIADILRRSRVLYCHEPSALISEAIACGCPVVLVSSSYWQPDPEKAISPGIAIDDDSPATLARLHAEAGQNIEGSQQVLDQCWLDIDNFIQLTQEATRRPSAPTHTTAALWLLPPERRHTGLPRLKQTIPDNLGAPDNGQQLPAWETPNEAGTTELAMWIKRLPSWRRPPHYHFVVVAHGTHPLQLNGTLNSLFTQSYSGISVSVLTDMPRPDELDPRCLSWSTSTPQLPENEHWRAYIHAGDFLASNAALKFTEFLHTQPQYLAFHTDTDCHDGNGKYLAPVFYSEFIDWVDNGSRLPGLILAHADIWESIDGWPEKRHGLDELEAMRLITDLLEPSRIGHLNGVMLHRQYNTDLQQCREEIPASTWLQLAGEHIQRTGRTGIPLSGNAAHSVRILPPEPVQRSLTVIVLTKDQPASLERCLRSLLERTNYPQPEILVIDNSSTDATRKRLDDMALDGVRRLAWERPFNFAAMCNHGASQASGELLVFLHDDIEIIDGNWLLHLSACIDYEDAAAAGPCLVDAAGDPEAGARIPLLHGIGHPAERLVTDALHADQAGASHRVAGLSAAALMVKQEVYAGLGGMDASLFADRNADMDFCVRLHAAGHRLWWSPETRVLHHSDRSHAATPDDNDALLKKWGQALIRHAGYNPHAQSLTDDPALIPDQISWRTDLRIAALAPTDCPSRYRIENPLREAQKAGQARAHFLREAYPPALLAPLNLKLIHCIASHEHRYLSTLQRYAELLDCKIVMDIDAIHTGNAPEQLQALAAFMAYCSPWTDRFTTGDASLIPLFDKELRLSHTPDLPDHDLGAKASFLKPLSRRRVVWHGRTDDLQSIAPSIANTAHAIDWIFIGPVPEELLQYAFIHIDTLSAGNLYRDIQQLSPDLAILPIAPKRVHDYAPQHDILQYALLGIPTLISDIPAWADLPAQRLPTDSPHWENALCDPATPTRYSAGGATRDAAIAYCDATRRTAQWLKVWQY